MYQTGDRVQARRELCTMTGRRIPQDALGEYVEADIRGLHIARFDHLGSIYVTLEDITPAPSGLRVTRRNRRTGTRVSVYDGIAARLDTSAGRWQTVCEDHGTIMSSRTRERAEAGMTCPDDWCEDCREQYLHPESE